MHYTKPMIELVFEIRRRADAGTKLGIKLAKPELLKELAAIYHSHQDPMLRTLIKGLMGQAGEEWVGRLQSAGKESGRTTVKIYRGQTSPEKSPTPGDTANTASQTTSSPRYYRGARVT